MVRLGLAAVLLVTAVAARCGEDREGPEPRGDAVFALLADNRLLKVSLGDGRVVFDQRLAPPPRSNAAGRYLAMSADRRTLFALVDNKVAAIDVRSGEVRDDLRLPRGTRFGALAVGPESGRLYIFGNRAGRVVTIPALDERLRELHVVVAIVDSDIERLVSSATVREGEGLDWSVYDAAVADDERRLFVSYHGSSTSGVDWIDIRGDRLRPCSRPPRWRGAACAGQVHGTVEPYGDGLLAATGHEPVVELGPGGDVRRRLRTRLTQTHLMELALDREARRLYAIGSCYAGGPGVGAVDLETGRARVVVPPQSASAGELPDACGDRVAVGADSLLVLARTTSAAPSPAWPGRLVFVDGRSGRVVRTVETPTEPVDVLVAQP